MGEKLVKFADDGKDLTLLPISTQTTDELSPGTYTFAFHPQRGTWLTHCARIPEVSFKVYGDTMARVKKSFDTYTRRPHNTGVLLEGEPGMGKSVFIKLIATEAYKRNMPVILIKDDVPGMIDLLSKIHTECLVIMDEFEKIFTGDNESARNGDVSSQNKLLSLMDGMDDNKKFFIASVNDSWRVSRFLKNRPGRFYYRFQFNNLNQGQIKEYLDDCLKNKKCMVELITSLIGHKINYDTLAAIVEELNSNHTVSETLQDLNLDKETCSSYNVRLFTDEQEWTCERFELNSSDMYQTVWLRSYIKLNGNKVDYTIRVNFKTEDIKLRGNSSWDEVLTVPNDSYNIESLPKGYSVISYGDLEFSPHHEYSGFRTYAKDV